MKGKILRANLYFGLILHFCATLLLICGHSFIKTWYYVFAWWSFILILDSINFRKTGSSPLSEKLSHFFHMAFLSVVVWLVFELFNLRLNNWAYLDLPAGRFLRWTGYFLAFATVIPALQELSLLFQALLRPKKCRLFRVYSTRSLLLGGVFLGILCIVLPLIWPRVFFHLVWLSLFFLVEPLNYWRRTDALLSDLEKDEWRRFWSWILAGLTAGVLWEFWNFWAGSHWVYTLPYLNFWRVFQMPVFGYLGFLPFALEIFAIQSLVSSIQDKVKKNAVLSILILVALVLFCVCGFSLIDRFSVIP